MRAAAALLVLWSHIKFNVGFTPERVATMPILATGLGAIGVDIFFVISGFVITMTASKADRGWGAFLANRIARVVPLYYAVSTFTLAALLGSKLLHHNVPAFSFRSIFNTYGFLPLFDARDFVNPVNSNGWTLSFETWFYAGFTLLMAFTSGRRAGRLMPYAMAAGVLTTGLLYHGSWFLPKFLFHPLTLEFSAGCVLYQVRRFLGKRSPALFLVPGLGLLLLAAKWEYLAAHLRVLSDPGLAWDRTIVWGGCAVCVVAAVAQIDLQFCPRWPRWLLLLGDASYSIYLIPPLIEFPLHGLIHFTENRFPGHAAFWAPVWGMLFCCGSIAGGILSWKFFEIPATRRTRNAFDRLLAPRLPAGPRVERPGYLPANS